ncbi:hypothetical protein ABBQ32_003748 [Trebouxia sp. C0010 RCD-2024]
MPTQEVENAMGTVLQQQPIVQDPSQYEVAPKKAPPADKLTQDIQALPLEQYEQHERQKRQQTGVTQHGTHGASSEPTAGASSPDAFRTACTRQQAELEAQQLLGPDFATSRHVQELCTVILSKTDAMKQLICSGRRAGEQEEANRRCIYVAAVTRLARELKEIQESYLCHKAAARRATKTEAVGQTQVTKVP